MLQEGDIYIIKPWLHQTDKMYSVLLLIVCCASAAQLKKSALKEAIEHGNVVPEEDHYADGEGHEHNAEYDHEAFLGKNQAEIYNKLSPDEAKQRLT